MQKEKGRLTRLTGLITIGAVILTVGLIGYLMSTKEKIVIQGNVEANEYRISGKLPGRVETFLFQEGDQVKKGDTLVIIDSPEIRAKLVQARAAQEAAESQKKKANKGARKEIIAAAYEMWQKAEVGVDIAKKSFDRVHTLYEKGVIPAQKHDEVSAQYQAAIVTAKAAKSQYEMAKNGAEAEDKEAAQALVKRAEGAVSEVTSYMNDIYLTAPISGEVFECFPKQGELVGTGAPIMTIVDIDECRFVFNIREDLLAQIGIGSNIDVEIPALGEGVHQAKITSMKAKGSYATWRSTNSNSGFDIKTFEVTARPTQVIPRLRPGMSVILKTDLEN